MRLLAVGERGGPAWSWSSAHDSARVPFEGLDALAALIYARLKAILTKGEGAMPRYVTLVDWTAQGIVNFKDSVDRYEAAAEQWDKQLGVRITDFYWTIGEHDMVAVVEAPDDESATAALLQLGSLGNVRTKTMRAFSRDEMRGVIDKAS